MFIFWWYAASKLRKECSYFTLENSNVKIKFGAIDEKWVPSKKMPQRDYKSIEYFRLLKNSDLHAWFYEETAC